MGSSYDWSYTVATPYEILGIPVNASEAEIKGAWRKLTQVAHPDRGGTSPLFVLTQQEIRSLLERRGGTGVARTAVNPGEQHESDYPHS